MSRDCEHGWLARQCPICELTREVERLRSEGDVSRACCEVLAKRFAPEASFVDLPDLISEQVERLTRERDRYQREAMATRAFMDTEWTVEAGTNAHRALAGYCAVRAENEKREDNL